MIFNHKELILLAIVGVATLLDPPGKRRQREQQKRQTAEQTRAAEKERRAQERQAARARWTQQNPEPAAAPRQRFSDEIYEHYERHGYWRGCGPGAWTSSKHPDEWEHPHLK